MPSFCTRCKCDFSPNWTWCNGFQATSGVHEHADEEMQRDMKMWVIVHTIKIWRRQISPFWNDPSQGLQSIQVICKLTLCTQIGIIPIHPPNIGEREDTRPGFSYSSMSKATWDFMHPKIDFQRYIQKTVTQVTVFTEQPQPSTWRCSFTCTQINRHVMIHSFKHQSTHACGEINRAMTECTRPNAAHSFASITTRPP